MEQIGVKKKQQSIADSLQQAILSGNIPGGTEMMQNDLAGSLGVSRMPVREALMILEYAGLVERLPNNHVKVAPVTLSRLEELFALLAAVEERELYQMDAAFGQTKEAEPVQRPELPSLLNQQAPSGQTDELQWHKTLAACQANPFLKKLQVTLTETYVSFAVRQPSTASEKRRTVFTQLVNKLENKKRLDANRQEIHGLFLEYSRLLASSVNSIHACRHGLQPK